MKNILVVGDWLVDEHWVTGVHRSSTASRTGDAHYRALHNLKSTVETFCGAGQTASLLYNINRSGKDDSQYHITGIGLWHKADTKALESKFDLSNLQERTPYRITPKDLKPVDRVKLINLCGILDKPEQELVCTTRIFRIYNAVSSDDVRFQRIDWELPLPRHDREEVCGYSVLCSETQINAGMSKIIEQIDNKIDIVVIKDLCKGVVTRPLVKALANRFAEQEWYVSAKAWNPAWIEELKRVNLKLFLIPQIAARSAIMNTSCEAEPISCWLTPSGKLDLMVYKKIDALVNTIHSNPHDGSVKPKPLIVVLPDFYEVIAYNPNIDESTCGNEIDSKAFILEPAENKNDYVVQTMHSPSKRVVPMAMASIFFPFMIDALSNRTEKTPIPASLMREMVAHAIHNTHKWMRFESDRIKNPDEWDPAKGYRILVNRITKNANMPAPDLHLDFIVSNWHFDKVRWAQATTGIGVINTRKTHRNPLNSRLELWRSMSEVKGYVCLDATRRGELRKLLREVRHFVSKARRHHSACMLLASPGSGKTYLVRQLAEAMKLHLLNFNITQMSSRKDLIDCFDTIVTTQARSRGEPLVVFIDEINAMLESSPVYDAFLSPLEDGVYVRGGKVFHIDPCIWIFSGTEDPSVISSDQPSSNRSSEKRSDFVSRLSLGIMDIMRPRESTKGSIENVYMGANIIINEYPDVRYISNKVLKLFHSLPQDVGVRKMKNLVKSFFDIQYGQVWAKNINETKVKEVMGKEKFSKWNGKSSEKKILIEV